MRLEKPDFHNSRKANYCFMRPNKNEIPDGATHKALSLLKYIYILVVSSLLKIALFPVHFDNYFYSHMEQPTDCGIFDRKLVIFQYSE